MSQKQQTRRLPAARARVDDELEAAADSGSGIARGESGLPLPVKGLDGRLRLRRLALYLLVEPDGLFVVARQVDGTHYGEGGRCLERL